MSDELINAITRMRARTKHDSGCPECDDQRIVLDRLEYAMAHPLLATVDLDASTTLDTSTVESESEGAPRLMSMVVVDRALSRSEYAELIEGSRSLTVQLHLSGPDFIDYRVAP